MGLGTRGARGYSECQAVQALLHASSGEEVTPMERVALPCLGLASPCLGLAPCLLAQRAVPGAGCS